MANTFLSSKEISIGASMYEKSMQKTAKSLLDYYGDKIALPEDVVTIDKSKKVQLRLINDVKKDEKILDIGPQSRMKYFSFVESVLSFVEWSIGFL